MRFFRTMGERCLAKGGFPENAVVLGPDRELNQEVFRHQDEFVRHKILDIFGDVSLVVRVFRAKCL